MIVKLLWLLVLGHIALSWALAVRRGLKARGDKIQLPPARADDLPAVSVIVPAWNEKGTIEKHIAALRRVEYPVWEAIILAGGEDGTQAAALAAAGGDERLRVVERGPEPKNAALNRGIQQSQYAIVVLLDADNMVTPGWLRALMAPISRGAAVAVGDSSPNRITWVTLEERMWHIYTYHILRLSWIQGDRSIAIRKELLERIGGLPEHTYAREDWDIWARLEPTGERVAFAEGAYLTTDRPATIKESWKHQVRWRRTQLNGIWEHRSILMKNPVKLVSQLYGYLLSVGMVIYALVGLSIILFSPGWLDEWLSLLVLLTIWLCGRRATVAFSVAAFTGDWKWAARAWMPVMNMLLVLAASLVAMLTVRRLNAYYKGPRNAPDNPLS